MIELGLDFGVIRDNSRSKNHHAIRHLPLVRIRQRNADVF